MARFSRLQVLNTMIDAGMAPVFYHPSVEVAREVAAACVAGGGRLLEFTNRGDHAWEVFNEMGSNLITKELVNAADYPGIAANVRGTLDLIRQIRGRK